LGGNAKEKEKKKSQAELDAEDDSEFNRHQEKKFYDKYHGDTPMTDDRKDTYKLPSKFVFKKKRDHVVSRRTSAWQAVRGLGTFENASDKDYENQKRFVLQFRSMGNGMNDWGTEQDTEVPPCLCVTCRAHIAKFSDVARNLDFRNPYQFCSPPRGFSWDTS